MSQTVVTMAVLTRFYCHLSPMPHTGYNVLTHLNPDCSEREVYTLMLTIQAGPSPTEPEQWEGADVLGLCRQPEDLEEAATQGGGAEEEGGGGPCSSHQGVLEDCKEMTVFVSTSRHNCCTHIPCANYESNWTRFFQLSTAAQCAKFVALIECTFVKNLKWYVTYTLNCMQGSILCVIIIGMHILIYLCNDLLCRGDT